MSWDIDYFERDFFGEFGKGHFSEERSQAEATFVLKALALRPGARILDLCCGYGRHAVNFAAHGFLVVAVDRSRSLLDRTAELAERCGVKVETVEQDMRRMTFSNEFDAVVNLFTSFGYFSEADDLSTLRGIRAALVPGGQFFIDVDNAPHVMRHFEPQDWRRSPDGGCILNSRRYDALSGRIEGTRVHIDLNEEPREYQMSIRLYTYPELVRQLADAGMTPVKAFGDYDGRSYDADSKRAIIVARRDSPS